MKNVHAILQKYGMALAALLFVLIAAGCDTLNSSEPEFAALTEEDLEAASAILGESLSDQNEGLMADMNDLTAEVDTRQIAYSGRRFWQNPMLRPCRGVNREFEASYDESTGTHTIHYSRTHESENCSKSVEVTLNYIFTDSAGNFIATPRVNKDDVASIAFEGTREGSGWYVTERGVRRSRSAEQHSEWNLTGLQSDVASLTGSQVNDGTFEFTAPDSTGATQTKSGTFHIEFSTVDVTLTQTRSGESDVETQVTGTIQYSMTMELMRNGETVVKEAEGTIELEGNGQALLRFPGLRKVYRVSLHDGAVRDAGTGSDG